MKEKELMSLHTNQRLLVMEMMSRGISVSLLVKELEIIEAKFGAHAEIIRDRDASIMPYASAVICGDKYLTKKLFQRAAIPTPEGEQFYPDQYKDALRYASSLGWPVVLKPSIGSHGTDCIMDHWSVKDLRHSLDRFAARHGAQVPFLLERQHPGKEFRVLITARGDYAVVHRDPAHVVGDGKNSIQSLAKMESLKRYSPRVNCLCPIVLDEEVHRFLSLSRRSLSSVPEEGERVYLRSQSNIAQGGTCTDWTEHVHPSMIEMARRALWSIANLPYAGVDILSTEPTAPQSEKNCIVLEINSNPGLHMHARPSQGKKRNVAAFLVDMIFPETARSL